jgi:hypothetical protein
MKKDLIPIEVIENKIYIIRGVKVMLDRDLALLYQVKTIALRQQVKRNKFRFPSDFIFQLTYKEAKNLVSQNVIPSLQSFGGALPYVFTEQGVAMLSSVLKSKQAIEISVLIVRAFIKLREMLQNHKDILVEVEKIKRDQKKHGQKISAIIDVINKLIAPKTDLKKEKIGFNVKK